MLESQLICSGHEFRIPWVEVNNKTRVSDLKAPCPPPPLPPEKKVTALIMKGLINCNSKLGIKLPK